jgi:type III restriction enzyme
MLELKNYQKTCLEQLKTYIQTAEKHGAKAAFVLQTERPYHEVAILPQIPYVCLRVPTGGGKTLMACHAVGMLATEYLHQERAVCLWLVPSNAIREQTLKALRDRNHPYRQAIDAQFSSVSIMDLTDALYIQHNNLESDTVIIVSTLAALRVEDTEGRKIYESAGALQHHFTSLSPSVAAKLIKDADGTVHYSLANVMRLWAPLVVMDEAHNARTKLSFETLERFSPSCIVEFTATPQIEHDPEHGKHASNVLAHVSAAQLKAEQMIKLPIRLHTRQEWKEVLTDSVQQQRKLEEQAKQEQVQTGEYIRPIVLIQAQPHRQGHQNITADVIKASLINDCKVPEIQIAIATGATREIEDIDLADSNCPIRFIITQQALKEGWDCPFAYIFCSVADVGSARDVEQLLGRVLRLPQAKSKQHEELNWAYAMVSSQRFLETIQNLREALVENGFERIEANQFLSAEPPNYRGLGELPLFAPIKTQQKVSEIPDLSKLDEGLRERISFDNNQGVLTVSGVLATAERDALEMCFTGKEAREEIHRLFMASRGQLVDPSWVMPPINIPALSFKLGKQIELLEESHFIDVDWKLAANEAVLSESDFPSEISVANEANLDISKAGKIEMRVIPQIRTQLALMRIEGNWTLNGLVNWIDRQIEHPDIIRIQAIFFIQKVIENLIETRHLTLNQLASVKYRLRDAIYTLIKKRREKMRNEGYQKLLFGTSSKNIIVSPELCFEIIQERYAPNWYYDGGYKFQKHALPIIGELKADGEEFECACYIDQLPQVRRWIRNLERKPDNSFWLPTATDRFYPDFIAELENGRFLVVESKGDVYWSNDDSKEKRLVGEVWAERSDRSCIFIMPKGKQLTAIADAIKINSKR